MDWAHEAAGGSRDSIASPQRKDADLDHRIDLPGSGCVPPSDGEDA